MLSEWLACELSSLSPCPCPDAGEGGCQVQSEQVPSRLGIGLREVTHVSRGPLDSSSGRNFTDTLLALTRWRDPIRHKVKNWLVTLKKRMGPESLKTDSPREEKAGSSLSSHHALPVVREPVQCVGRWNVC